MSDSDPIVGQDWQGADDQPMNRVRIDKSSLIESSDASIIAEVRCHHGRGGRRGHLVGHVRAEDPKDRKTWRFRDPSNETVLGHGLIHQVRCSCNRYHPINLDHLERVVWLARKPRRGPVQVSIDRVHTSATD